LVLALRYECRIHSFGAASTTIRRTLGWIKKAGAATGPGKVVVTTEEGESKFVRLRPRSWARLIHRTHLENPELCPQCKHPMKILAAISSPAQDAVIEAILRERGEWDPPWRRKRKARAPPPSPLAVFPGGAEDRSQLGSLASDDFNQEVREVDGDSAHGD
jgi:hypothetical protein